MTVTVFRAYDVRGVYKKELTVEIAEKIGAAFGSYLEGGNITLGRDTRDSGPSIENAFLAGVLGTGCNVASYGILPIPILSFATWAGKYDAAAYISASHNPPEYNGIRFRTSEGYGLLYHETDMMRIYHEGSFRTEKGQISMHTSDEAVESYAKYVAEKLDLKRSLKVVLDMGNGSACIMDTLYKKLGFNPIVMNGKMDGMFSGRGPNPTKESLQDSAKLVLEEKADYGVGFDPDADRGIIIDDLGRIIPPEKIAIILAKERYNPGDSVVSGFDCSMILEKELEPAGIKVIRERVGDVYVANRVKQTGAVLGVERSGHFFVPEIQYSDDPFAMSLLLGEIISDGQKLSELADEIPDYPYLQKSINCEIDPRVVMKRLEEELTHFKPDTTDGLKIITNTYSALIRPSNTEPLVRFYIETSGDDLEDLAEWYEQMIRNAMKD
jgi:phosphomannomutase/phosphoglucomutase